MNRNPPPSPPVQLVRPPWFYKQWLIAGNPALFFDRLVQDYGDFIYYRGLFNFYLVNHPALVKQVLQETHDAFNKQTVVYKRFAVAFGDGLVVSEGERWKWARKLIQQMFGPSTIKQYFDLMVQSATELADRWEPACRDGSVFDISKDMGDVTLEIAGRALFHDGFDEASERIHRWTQTINRYSAKPPLPIIRSYWFPSHVNLGLKATLRQFHAFLQELIDARRSSSESQQPEEHAGKDLLTILLQAKDEETGRQMHDQDVKEEVLGMIIGGHETSSAALTWIWYELHQHPEVQRQLHEEIDRVVGQRPLTPEDIPNLVYTRMVIEEAIRLHPPFWFENRNVAKEVELGGETLKPGAVVAFSRYSLHRHPGFWEDPDRFDPERFRPGAEENKRSTYASVPFGGGPRICVGIHFAMMELVVVLAVIAQRYRVVVDASDRHQMAAHLTMTPRYGVRVRLEAR